jgi:hypothetical protein
MTEKTFKQRVKEEAVHFAEIYAAFKEDLEEKSLQGVVQTNWLHLFAVPIDGLLLHERPDDNARRALGVPHRHDAVLKAVQQLCVHELRLGALEIKDFGITPALDARLLTPDDIVPPSPRPPGPFERLAGRQKPDDSDPIFWRTLLEIFCRAFVASQGEKPWALSRWIDLAFDLDEIRSSSARQGLERERCGTSITGARALRHKVSEKRQAGGGGRRPSSAACKSNRTNGR